MWLLVAPWDISIDLDCGRTTDPDMVLCISLGLVATMVPGDGKGHPDGYGPSSSVDYGPKHGPRRQPNPLESAWLSMATGAMDINTDPGYRGTRI